jgi:hypothetical protein
VEILIIHLKLSNVMCDTTLCDKVCQCLAVDAGVFPGTPVSSTNKTDCHDITEILLKVEVRTHNVSGDRH